MATRISYHHGDLKQSILENALLELERNGFEKLSLRALAHHAGVSKTAPYRHFRDKNALLEAIAAEGFSLLADRLEMETRLTGRPGDMLRTVMSAYVGFALERPRLYRLMFSEPGYTLHSERCRLNSQRAISVLIRCVDSCIKAGWKPGANPDHLVLSVWGLGHGWAGILADNLVPEDLEFKRDLWIESAMALLDSEAL